MDGLGGGRGGGRVDLERELQKPDLLFYYKRRNLVVKLCLRRRYLFADMPVVLTEHGLGGSRPA